MQTGCATSNLFTFDSVSAVSLVSLSHLTALLRSRYAAQHCTWACQQSQAAASFASFSRHRRQLIVVRQTLASRRQRSRGPTRSRSRCTRPRRRLATVRYARLACSHARNSRSHSLSARSTDFGGDQRRDSEHAVHRRFAGCDGCDLLVQKLGDACWFVATDLQRRNVERRTAKMRKCVALSVALLLIC